MYSLKYQLSQFGVGQDDWESLFPEEHDNIFLSITSNTAVNSPVDAIHRIYVQVGHMAGGEEVICGTHSILEQQLLSPMNGLRVVVEENSFGSFT